MFEKETHEEREFYDGVDNKLIARLQKEADKKRAIEDAQMEDILMACVYTFLAFMLAGYVIHTFY